MGLSETHGSIARGKVANVFITKEIPSYEFMPYAFGSDLIDTIILRGKIYPQNREIYPQTPRGGLKEGSGESPPWGI
jgi:imidazolonepropionase-like amidohydrolase